MVDDRLGGSARGTFRILQAHLGRYEFGVASQAKPLIGSDHDWSMLGQRDHDTLSRAFAMTMKLAGGIVFLIHAPDRGYPYRLFLLLHDDRSIAEAFAKEFISDTLTLWCMMDPLSRAFKVAF